MLDVSRDPDAEHEQHDRGHENRWIDARRAIGERFDRCASQGERHRAGNRTDCSGKKEGPWPNAEETCGLIDKVIGQEGESHDHDRLEALLAHACRPSGQKPSSLGVVVALKAERPSEPVGHHC